MWTWIAWRILPFWLVMEEAYGQQPRGTGIFGAAQAEAGQVDYEKTCGRCHTVTLMGREGKREESPVFSTLSEADQKFILESGGKVPPLAGPVFVARWGSKTAAELIARFQEAKFSFKQAGISDDESIVNITAYVLQANGAKPGSRRLTRRTETLVGEVTSSKPIRR